MRANHGAMKNSNRPTIIFSPDWESAPPQNMEGGWNAASLKKIDTHDGSSSTPWTNSQTAIALSSIANDSRGFIGTNPSVSDHRPLDHQNSTSCPSPPLPSPG